MICDIVWLAIVFTSDFKPEVWPPYFGADFGTLHEADQRWEEDCVYRVAIRGNSAADSAAKNALVGDISVELISQT